jgi:TP901 family phage tail tape measure protein
MIKTAPIVVNIRGEDRLSKDLAASQARLRKFAVGISKLGAGLTKYVSLPLAGAGAASVKFALDLNASMANIATLVPKNRQRVDELKSSIQDLSMSTGKSTDDLATGMYDVISSFGDSTEAVDQLTIASKASVAGLATTQEAIGLLAATTKGYGDTSAAALQKVSDLSFLTVKLGKTTFPELAASIGKVVPLAAALNVKQEELFGTFATLTGVTGDTAEVATQVQSVFSAMLKPAEDLTKAVKGMGFESASTMMKQIGLRESLIRIGSASGGIDSLKKAVKGLGFASVETMVKQLGFEEASERLGKVLERNDDQLAKMFGRKEGLVATLALLGGQSDEYTKKLKAMNISLGATEEAYREVDQGINKTGRSWEKTKARLMVFAQRVGDRLLPILERLFSKLEPWLRKLEKMDAATLEWGLKIGGLAIALGPVILGIGKLSTATLSLLNLFGRPLKAAGVVRGLNQIGGAAGGATRKVGRLSRALGAIGLVGEAAAVGGAIGTAVSELWEQPRAREKFKSEEAILRRRQKFEGLLKTGSIVEKTGAAKQLEKDMDALGDVMTSFGGDLQGIASIFTGEENVVDRYNREWNRIRETREKLLQSAQADIEQFRKEGVFSPKAERTEKVERTEKTVNIKFQADVPGSVRVGSTERRLAPAQTGAILSGL